MKELYLHCPLATYLNNKFWFVNASFPGLFSVDRDSLAIDSYGFAEGIEDNVEAGWYGAHFIDGDLLAFLPSNAKDIVIFNTQTSDFDKVCIDSDNGITQTMAIFDDINDGCVWVYDGKMETHRIQKSPVGVSDAPKMSVVLKTIGSIRSIERISEDETIIVTAENKILCFSLKRKEIKEKLYLGDDSNTIQHVRFDGEYYWMTFSDSCEVWKWDANLMGYEIYRIEGEIEWDTRSELRIPFSNIMVYEDIVILTNFRLQHIYYIDRNKSDYMIRKLFEYPKDFRYIDDYFSYGHSNYASCYRVDDLIYFFPMSGANMMFRYNVNTKELTEKLFCIEKGAIKGYKKMLHDQVERCEVWRERVDFSVADVIDYLND